MDDDTQMTWQEILQVLEAELNNPAAYGMLSTQLHLLEADASKMVIGVPNAFTLRTVSNKYKSQLESAIQTVTGSNTRLELKVDKQVGEPPAPSHSANNAAGNNKQPSQPSQPAVAVVRNTQKSNLNPKYTFSNFVVGSHNKFPHATALRVADEPGHAYNPLFIYGGVGLGKTHLMHAIGNQIMLQRENFKVMYLSSERFTNELINAFRDGTTLDFKNRYRSVDLLLIDDIQFIGGKESTQEEFFHTFNELHGAGKQIVITSDRSPNEISTLENRLRSRFQMGLICDIQPPDFETRIAILKKKADMGELNIPDDVHHYIARVYKSNVRELEGALLRLMAYTSMTGTQPTVSMAQQVLGQIPDRDLNTDLIQEVTAKYFNKKITDLTGTSREKEINLARQIAIYLCRELTDLSFPKIGEHFGGRDHSTIMHAYERIKKRKLEEAEVEKMVNDLVSHLK